MLINKVYADFASEFGTVKGNDPLRGKFTDVGTIINELLPYVFVFSGILLFFFLISGGFDLMVSGGDPKKMEQGKEKITAAIVGFLLVFAAFWIYQIIRFVLGMV